MPTWLCTALKTPAATRPGRPPPTWARARSSTWSWNPHCDRPWKKGNYVSSISPRLIQKARSSGLKAVRWEHPTLGTVPPIKFISLAEDTGVINAIGNWVLGEAARQARAWVAAGYKLVPIAVNVSAMQFSHVDFIRTISRTLKPVACRNGGWSSN